MLMFSYAFHLCQSLPTHFCNVDVYTSMLMFALRHVVQQISQTFVLLPNLDLGHVLL